MVVLVDGSVGSVFSTALEVLVVGGNPDNGLKVGHQATPASCPTSQQSTAPGTPSPFSEDFDVVGSLHGHIESLKRSGGNKIPVFSCLVVISNESVGGLEGAPGVKTLVCLSSPPLPLLGCYSAATSFESRPRTF